MNTSVQNLPTQVVRLIIDSENTDPAIHISALNCQISREAEHGNPRWQDVELLDAGSARHCLHARQDGHSVLPPMGTVCT